MDKCVWVYRPGINNSHWAYICDGGMNYLSKLTVNESYVGVADYYNARLCPICGRPIQMDYHLIKD